MKSIALRRVDDDRQITVCATCELSENLPPGKTAFDSGYRRIAGEREVPVGRARIFETGGTAILIVRQDGNVCAFQADALIHVDRGPHLLRSQQFVIEPEGQCTDTHSLQPLPAIVEGEWIWVGVESGRPRS